MIPFPGSQGRRRCSTTALYIAQVHKVESRQTAEAAGAFARCAGRGSERDAGINRSKGPAQLLDKRREPGKLRAPLRARVAAATCLTTHVTRYMIPT